MPTPFDVQSGTVTWPAAGDKVRVNFARPFHTKPTVSVAASGLAVDLIPAQSFSYGASAADVDEKGFTVVFAIGKRVRSVSAAWIAHS